MIVPQEQGLAVDGVGEVLLAGLGVDADGFRGAEQLGDGDDFDPRAG
ncbi:hypothetical protein GZH49_26700 [Nocardia terpenica]